MLEVCVLNPPIDTDHHFMCYLDFGVSQYFASQNLRDISTSTSRSNGAQTASEIMEFTSACRSSY